jgi:hypothetical protein
LGHKEREHEGLQNVKISLTQALDTAESKGPGRAIDAGLEPDEVALDRVVVALDHLTGIGVDVVIGELSVTAGSSPPTCRMPPRR